MSPEYKVVGHRLDALTVAYRVAFPRELRDELVRASEVAKKHGASEFRFGEVLGAMKYSRADRAWLVTCPRFRVLFALNAPGAVGDEPGWTLEIVWSAHALAVMSVERARRASHRIARSCGVVFARRLRRIDLCADVAGWQVEHADVEHFVRRPHARADSHAFSADDVIRLEDDVAGELEAGLSHERVVTHYRSHVTGFSFCPGRAMMARVYDKRCELKLKRAEFRAAEEARWRAGGWDGEAPIARVEYQIRGEAARDFGLSDPDHATQDFRDEHGRLRKARDFGGFENVMDRVWRGALAWLRLTRESNADETRAARRQVDPRWDLLSRLSFIGAENDGAVHKRVRRRGGASTEMTFGCVLSTLGQKDKLERMPRIVKAGRTASDVLAIVHALFAKAAGVVTESFVEKWGPDEACEHVIEVQNAAWAREYDDGRFDSDEWLAGDATPLAAAS